MVRNTMAKAAKGSESGSGRSTKSEGKAEIPKKREAIINMEARPINVGEFAKSRSIEINKMMKKVNINVVGSKRKTNQALPNHMRRRASSHNVKRLPRRLRDQYKLEKAKSEGQQRADSKVKPKRSRRHRRRHSNLRQEFERRQREYAWLETHLWHAKRFKMTDLWGMRIPVQPSDKSARATYRAVAKHCLIEDISYHGVIEVQGPEDEILSALSQLTNQQTGLTFGAKTYLSGSHHGELILYHKNRYPAGAIGPVNFLWRAVSANEANRQLWIWVHPACYEMVLAEVKDVCKDTSIQVNALKDDLVRFRLRGPLSHPILLDALETADVVSMTTEDSSSSSPELWWEKYYSNTDNMTIHTEQQSSWQKLQGVVSSSELSPRCVVALTVRDPRILIPQKRTKIMADPDKVKAHPTSDASSGYSFNCSSPLWNADIRKTVKSTQMSQHRLNQARTKLLVPGTELNLGRQESRIPVLLLHNPGVKGQPGNRQSMMGYGAGWDIVLPAGWAMGFWIALIYRGARVGGLRESRSCALQQGLPHFPDDAIDTEAGRTHAVMVCKELEKTQSRKPPAKRSNYAKLGVPTPFHIEWCKLLVDWKGESGQEEGQVASTDGPAVVVMRNKHLLQSLDNALNDIKRVSKNVKGRQELMERYKAEVITVSSVPGKSQKRSAPDPDDSHAVSQKKKFKSGDMDDARGQGDSDLQESAPLNSAIAAFVGESASDDTSADLFTDSLLADMYVCVQLSLINKGAPGPYSLICLPSSADLEALANSSQYGGPMEPVHKEYVLPRKPNNKTKSVEDENGINKKVTGRVTTDKLGVPNLEGLNLVKFGTRKVIGYLINGVHALSTGRGFGVGYCCMAGLRELVRGKPKDREAVVLVRDTGSLQYRFAKVKVQM